MATYSAFTFSATTTQALAVAAEPVDRAVKIVASTSQIRVGFDSSSGYRTAAADFILPEGEELWLWVDYPSAPVAAEVLVSRAPGI